jgi:hypothetical protein
VREAFLGLSGRGQDKKKRKEKEEDFSQRLSSFERYWTFRTNRRSAEFISVTDGSIFSFDTLGSVLGKDYAVAIVTLFCGTLAESAIFMFYQHFAPEGSFLL